MRRAAPLMLIMMLSVLPRALSAAPPAPSSSGAAGDASDPGQEKTEPFSLQSVPGEALGVAKHERPVGRRLGLEMRDSESSTENPFLENTAIVAFGLLLLCTALVAGTLLIGLRQHRSLLALESQMSELKKAVDGFRKLSESSARGSARGQDLEAAAGGRSMEDQRSPSTPPISPSVPDRQPRGTAYLLGERRPGSVGDLGRGSPPVQRHQEVYDLFDRLRREAPRLAAKFADPALRERFQGELEAPVGARLDRLRILTAEGEESVLQRWLGPDLIATLDSLARFYSAAVDEERRGQANGLALELRSWLYDYFGSACRSEGWFAIDPVEPYRTAFDPKFHHAIAGRDVQEAQGQVVSIKTIGRRDAKTGALLQKAEVIVGR